MAAIWTTEDFNVDLKDLDGREENEHRDLQGSVGKTLKFPQVTNLSLTDSLLLEKEKTAKSRTCKPSKVHCMIFWSPP